MNTGNFGTNMGGRISWPVFCLSMLFAISLQASPSFGAGQMTLADLRQMCATSDVEGKAACRFYILGAFEGLSMAGSSQPTANGQFRERQAAKQFCIPENLPQSAMVQKVAKSADADLRTYPADANMPAVSFIGAVIATSYSCK